MNNSDQTIKVFKEAGSNLGKNWIGLNNTDCTTKIGSLSKDALEDYKMNFSIMPGETILFVRDNSFFSNRNQGLVLTDMGIHIVRDNNHPEDVLILNWHDIQSVEIDKQYKAYYSFELVDGKKISVFKGDFMKNILEEKDVEILEDVSIRFLGFLKSIVNSVETIPIIDVERVLGESCYSYCEVRPYVQPEKAQQLFNVSDVVSDECPQDLKEYYDGINKLEMSIKSIDKRFESVYKGFRVANEQMNKAFQNLLNQRNASRGYQPPKQKNEAIVDLILCGVQIAGNIYSHFEEKKARKQLQLRVDLTKIQEKKWEGDTLNYMAFKLDNVNKMLCKVRDKYDKLVEDFTDVNGNAIGIFVRWFALCCKSICMQQNLLSRLYQVRDGKEQQIHLLENVVLSELSKLPECAYDKIMNYKK